jgi:hypothetical protein
LTSNETRPEQPLRPGNEARQKSSKLVKAEKNMFIYNML